MPATLEQLEERVGRLEAELAQLRQLVTRPTSEAGSADLGDRLIRDALASQPAISAAVAEAYAKMGITGEPIGSEKLQEMMRAAGIRPEDNLCSREIIAMREE